MVSPRSLARLTAAGLAAAALSAPAAHAQPIDAHAVAPRHAASAPAPQARAHDDGTDWTQTGLIAAAGVAFAGAFGVAVRPRGSRASA